MTGLNIGKLILEIPNKRNKQGWSVNPSNKKVNKVCPLLLIKYPIIYLFWELLRGFILLSIYFIANLLIYSQVLFL